MADLFRALIFASMAVIFGHAQTFNPTNNICRGFDAFCQLPDGIVAAFYGNRYALLRQTIVIGPDDSEPNDCPLGPFNFKFISIDNQQTDIDPALTSAALGVTSCARLYDNTTANVFLMARNGYLYDASNVPSGDTPFSSPLTSTRRLITRWLPQAGFPIDVALTTGTFDRFAYLYAVRHARATGYRWFHFPGTPFNFQGSTEADTVLDTSSVSVDVDQVGDCASIRTYDGERHFRCHARNQSDMRVAFGLIASSSGSTATTTFAADGASVLLNDDWLIGALFRGLTNCAQDTDAGGAAGPLRDAFFDTNAFCTACDDVPPALQFGSSGSIAPALPGGLCPASPGTGTGSQYDLDAIASHPTAAAVQYSFYGNRVYVHGQTDAADDALPSALRPTCRSRLFPDVGMATIERRVEAAFTPRNADNAMYLVFRDDAIGYFMQRYDQTVDQFGFAPNGPNVAIEEAVRGIDGPLLTECRPRPPGTRPTYWPLTEIYSAFTTDVGGVEKVVFLVECSGRGCGGGEPSAIMANALGGGAFMATKGFRRRDIRRAGLGRPNPNARQRPGTPNAAVFDRQLGVLYSHQSLSSRVYVVPDPATIMDDPRLVCGTRAVNIRASERYSDDPSFINLVNECL